MAAAVLASDQATKAWALGALESGPVAIAGPLRLRLTYNRGAAFGLGDGAAAGLVPFLALGTLCVVVVMVMRSAADRPAVAAALGLVTGGAVGNLVDRLLRPPGLLRGPVLDFVDVGFWPVFNLADAAITVGCLTLVVASWTLKPEA